MEAFTSAIGNFFHLLLLSIAYFIGIVLGLILLTITCKKLLFKRKVKAKTLKNNDLVLQVKIPTSNEQKEDTMEEFINSLHRVLPKNTTFSLDLASVNQFLSFFIVIDKRFKNIIESQLFAQFPEVEAEVVNDYFPKDQKGMAFMEFKFKHSSKYPVNTYRELKEDLLKSLSAIVSKTAKSEKFFFQFVLKTSGTKIWDRNFTNLIFKLSGKKYTSSQDPNVPPIKFLKDILFTGKLRIGYLAENKQIASSNLEVISGIFKDLKGPFNEIKKVRKSGIKYEDLIYTRLFETKFFGKGDFWTSAEIVALYHFPYKGSVVTNIASTTSRRAPAPDILPREGLMDPDEISYIGETNFRNEKHVFGIKRVDRRRHLYVVGKTGSGKSKLLELLIMADLQKDGCCLLDPHGDLAEEVLKYVPKKRISDVVYINPSDEDFPIGFNPLESVDDYQMRQHLATFFISIFKKLLAFNWNPRMEHLIRYITLALLETPDSNVLGIPRILSDTAYRQRVIMQIKDPVVKSFWINEFSSSDQGFIDQAVLPIINKVGQFTANPTIRNMVGQQKNALDFAKFMNEGKIVIINISKGKLGDENTALLGSMFITKIQQAALQRANIPEDERKDFYFYVDEFQNFATDAFSSILSEARKYRLNLTIAHQYIAQLPSDVRATAFGNVGSMIVFGVGGDDAGYLSKEFAPVFSPDDMVSLNLREMYIKMSIDGKITPPFSARTIDIPKIKQDYSREIIDKSRMKYARNRVEVGNEIKQWTKSIDARASGASMKEGGFPEPII
jgi:energy-coupling factor transporter ATP-binding protein EcfA2